MISVIRLLTLTLFFIALGCSYALEEVGLYKVGANKVTLSIAAQFANSPVNFETVKSTSLRTCLDCHTNGKRSMNTAEKVLASKDAILESIHKGTMPPPTSGYFLLDACEIQILETWIDDQTHSRVTEQKIKDLSACGEIEAPKSRPPVDYKNLDLTFTNVKAHILAPKCLSCHAGPKAFYLYLLDDLERIKRNDLIAATAEESVLYQVTLEGAKYFMPPPKSGIPALSEDERDFMKRWIEAGAQP